MSNHPFEIATEKVLLIEWHKDGEIRQIHTENGKYFVSHQKDGTLLLTNDAYEDIEGKYWLAPGQPQPGTYGEDAREVASPTGEALQKLLQELEKTHFVDKTFWCVICEDHTFEETFGISECGHIRYIDSHGWGGCGMVDGDSEVGAEDYDESFKLLVQGILAHEDCSDPDAVLESLVQCLNPEKVERIWKMTDDFNFECDGIEPAIAYLDSLNSQAQQQHFDRAVQWIQKNRPAPPPPTDEIRDFCLWLSIHPSIENSTMLANQARTLELEVTSAYKPGFCCWYSIKIKGTLAQKRELQAFWEERELEVFNYRPGGAF